MYFFKKISIVLLFVIISNNLLNAAPLKKSKEIKLPPQMISVSVFIDNKKEDKSGYFKLVIAKTIKKLISKNFPEDNLNIVYEENRLNNFITLDNKDLIKTKLKEISKNTGSDFFISGYFNKIKKSIEIIGYLYIKEDDSIWQFYEISEETGAFFLETPAKLSTKIYNKINETKKKQLIALIKKNTRSKFLPLYSFLKGFSFELQTGKLYTSTGDDSINDFSNKTLFSSFNVMYDFYQAGFKTTPLIKNLGFSVQGDYFHEQKSVFKDTGFPAQYRFKGVSGNLHLILHGGDYFKFILTGGAGYSWSKTWFDTVSESGPSNPNISYDTKSVYYNGGASVQLIYKPVLISAGYSYKYVNYDDKEFSDGPLKGSYYYGGVGFTF